MNALLELRIMYIIYLILDLVYSEMYSYFYNNVTQLMLVERNESMSY